MNNPVRAAVQRWVEAPRLLRLGGRVPGAHVLEMGCGRGVGTELIFDAFGAARVDAFDLDPDMVSLARRRLAHRGDRVRLWVGDATRIPAGDGAYRAAFDFGIVHHVPAWRDVLDETWRVLAPGGRFYVEEVLARFIHHPIWRRVLEHPMEDRFDLPALVGALDARGFRVLGARSLFDQFCWVVAEKPS